jgi:CheY-like chemotaxis protein
MTPDVIEHAFEPFFTTKPAGQGTGLGLSQVFGFISQSSGLVRIESEAGRGATVHLFLPRDQDAADVEAAPLHAAAVPKRLTTANVLLVEDEPDIRDLAADALREAGCTVIQAKDGPSGLNALRAGLDADGGTIDILVADVGLPGGLNGRQLADAARALSPTLPVLLITGYAGEALGPGVQLDQPMELLSKPFALDALAARVEAMLATARAAQPAA